MKAAKPYRLPAILFMGMLACSNSENTIIDADLLDVVWRVDSLQTPDTNMVADSTDYLHIRFDETFEVTGSDGCTSFWAKYSIQENGRIKIYEIGIPHIELPCSTQTKLMANTYRDILEDIEPYSIEGGILILSSLDRGRFVFYTAE